jgi:hypothetical protein
MATRKCQCGFDSGVEAAPSGYNVAAEEERTGMKWVMLLDGHSVWLCPKCYEAARRAAIKIRDILGSSYFSASSLRISDKASKR